MKAGQIDAAMQEAVGLHRAGQTARAEAIYRRVLKAAPANPDALHLLGLLAYQGRRLGEAAELIAKACRGAPDQPLFHYNLGKVLADRGEDAAAIAAYGRAIDLSPAFGDALANLGRLLARSGRMADADAALRRAASLLPDQAELHFAHATVLLALGRLEAAEQAFVRGLALAPDNAIAWSERGNTLQRLGRCQDAIAALRRALELQPGMIETKVALAGVYFLSHRVDDAERVYRDVLLGAPDHRQALTCLGNLLTDRGDWPEGAECYRRLQRLHPGSGVELLLAMQMPTLPESTQQIDAARARMLADIERLKNADLEIVDPLREVGQTAFYLAYQGGNDRELHSGLAALYRRACPDLGFVAPHCLRPRGPRTRIRVGFVSRYFCAHTIGRLLSGVVTGLDREHLEVFCFAFPPADDFTRRIAAASDAFFLLPAGREARQVIANAELDVLIYPDIGMDFLTYLLAFARLAPVQCVAWGHPSTTGIDTIDYFLSSALQEGPDAQRRYRERVVLFEHPLYVYPRPPTPSTAERSEFGFAAGTHVYLCPQTPFKLHPDFDALIAAILRRDRAGVVVLVAAEHQRWTELLRHRLRRTMPDVEDRVIVLPRQDREAYFRLLAVCDVMLDCRPFGGGLTTLDALAIGTPIVTWPGESMAGRFTYSCYARMGIGDCVVDSAEHYVERAVTLAGDPVSRAQLASRLRAASDCLFDNPAPVRELEKFVLSHGDRRPPPASNN